jgi:pSer/pThr/pTyr-binding forkhead associated (FHA) protein
MSSTSGIVPGIKFENGGALPSNFLLNDCDILTIGSSIALFRRFPAPPVFRGKPCAELPLDRVSRLCFGRVAEAASPDEEVVFLDSQDRRISRRHLTLWRQDRDFLLRDESPTGTFLNGQRFESHRLVVGDRFQLGGYSFEFTGISLRRTRPRIGAKVEATDVGLRRGLRPQRDQSSYRPMHFFRYSGRERTGKVHPTQCALRPEPSDQRRGPHPGPISRRREGHVGHRLCSTG